jgi:hypothetical protein
MVKEVKNLEEEITDLLRPARLWGNMLKSLNVKNHYNVKENL